MSQLKFDLLYDLIKDVERPARYIGGEVGLHFTRNKRKDAIKLCLVFPDVYEVGMSNLGFRLLHQLLLERDDVICERAFIPADDLYTKMQKRDIYLFSLESKIPVKDFDVIALSVPSEMAFLNIPKVLKTIGIPPFSKDRDGLPLLIGGGSGIYNPEPIAPIFDGIFIGEIEDSIDWFIGVLRDAVSEKFPREYLRERASSLADRGLYVSFLEGIEEVRRQFIHNPDRLNKIKYWIIPNVPPVHDRVTLELQRGCTNGCRFCQAGFVTRPARQTPLENVVDIARNMIAQTGYEELGLLSLSASDYPFLKELLKILHRVLPQTSLSVPSLRVDSVMDREMIQLLGMTRHSGFTFAPETVSKRLREVINKNIDPERLFECMKMLAEEGWRRFKLYFILGLPEEKREDVEQIADFLDRLKRSSKSFGGFRINCSFSIFIPKPHTPFQWDPLIEKEEFFLRLKTIKTVTDKKRIKFDFRDYDMALVETLLSRGNRSMAKVLVQYNEMGYDQYHNHPESFLFLVQKNGIKWQERITRLDYNVKQPWELINTGVDREFLVLERELASKGKLLNDCLFGACSDCGVCSEEDTEPVRAKSGTGDLCIYTTINKKEYKTRFTYRIRLTKLKEGVFFSHREIMRLLRMALRTANIPLVYTEGFNKKVKLDAGPPAPVGIKSLCELFDFYTTEKIDIKATKDNLNRRLPDGLRIAELIRIMKKKISIQASIESIEYSADEDIIDIDEISRITVKTFKDQDSLLKIILPFGSGGIKRLLKKDVLSQEPIRLIKITKEKVHFKQLEQAYVQEK